MLWQKFNHDEDEFSYDKYAQSLDRQDYNQAYECCSKFLPNDQNARICGWYAQYFLLTKVGASFHKLDAEIKNIYEDAKSKNIYEDAKSRKLHGYDENALYLLGWLLFERGSEAKGVEVLQAVAALKKKPKVLSEANKKARFYLEEYYLQKWENSQRQQIEHLMAAAECCGHNTICYLCAEELQKNGDRSDEADRYEHRLAEDFCVVKIDKATYHRDHAEDHLDRIHTDIRKKIGSIASDVALVKAGVGRIEGHMETMCQMIHDLPEATRKVLHQEFNGFRTQMDELSERMETREEIVQSLVEKAQAINLEQRGNQDVVLEIKALAEQISAADQDREDRLAQSIASLKNAILENDNQKLRDIIKEAEAEIKSRFQDRLSEDARQSIVTALFTLNFYKQLSQEKGSLIEYSGVVILATSALEIELKKRLYNTFIEYVEYVEEQCGLDILNRWYRPYFTLKSFKYVAGVDETAEHEKREQLFKAFIQDSKYSSRFSGSEGSLFQFRTGAKLRDRLESFAGRLDKLGDIRNKAAHIGPVTFKDAEEACHAVFLSSQKDASNIMDESISLLKLLLNSCNP